VQKLISHCNYAGLDLLHLFALWQLNAVEKHSLTSFSDAHFTNKCSKNPGKS